MASASTNPTSSQTPQGDITFTYTDPVRSAIVTDTASSVALCRASPVWRNFLYPPWGSTRFIDPGSDTLPQGSPQYSSPSFQTIDFTEDSYPALKILLDIAHGKRPTQHPAETPSARSYHVAVLCDRYECVELAKPIWRGFSKPVAGRSLEYFWKLESLMIASVFGDEAAFKMVANRVASSLRVTKSGALLDTHRKVVSPDLVLPLEILEHILKGRLRAIGIFLEIAYNNLEFYTSPGCDVCGKPQIAPYRGVSADFMKKFNIRYTAMPCQCIISPS